MDRDLMYFYPRMRAGGPIIIDDVDGEIYLSRNYQGIPYVDLKHRISSLLLAAFEAAGFIRVVKRLENTAFCQRGERKYDKTALSQIALDCYRELVFADTHDKFWEELATWSENALDVRAALRMRGAIPASVRKVAGKILRLWKAHGYAGLILGSPMIGLM